MLIEPGQFDVQCRYAVVVSNIKKRKLGSGLEGGLGSE